MKILPPGEMWCEKQLRTATANVDNQLKCTPLSLQEADWLFQWWLFQGWAVISVFTPALNIKYIPKAQSKSKTLFVWKHLYESVHGCIRCEDAGSAQIDDLITPTWQQFKQSNYSLAPLHKSANHQTAAGHMTQLGRIFMAFALAAFAPGLSSPFVQDVGGTYVHMRRDAAAVN